MLDRIGSGSYGGLIYRIQDNQARPAKHPWLYKVNLYLMLLSNKTQLCPSV